MENAIFPFAIPTKKVAARYTGTVYEYRLCNRSNQSILMKSLIIALSLATATPFVLAEPGLVFQSSFEAPVVGGRTPKANGGDIANQGEKPEWVAFADDPIAGLTTHRPHASGTNAGGIIAGVTNNMARTGDQSLFVEAKHLSVPYEGVVLGSAPIRIVPGQEYMVGIWGRNDASNPLTAALPQLFLKLQIDYFSDAGVTQVGDSDYLVEPMPGSPDQPPIFTNSAWRQIKRRIVTPENAKYMTVIWRCESSPDPGSVSGVMYFDDVTVEGQVPSKADIANDAEKAKSNAATPSETTQAPATGSTPAATPEATPTPAASATPSATPEASATPKHRKHKSAQ